MSLSVFGQEDWRDTYWRQLLKGVHLLSEDLENFVEVESREKGDSVQVVVERALEDLRTMQRLFENADQVARGQVKDRAFLIRRALRGHLMCFSFELEPQSFFGAVESVRGLAVSFFPNVQGGWQDLQLLPWRDLMDQLSLVDVNTLSLEQRQTLARRALEDLQILEPSDSPGAMEYVLSRIGEGAMDPVQAPSTLKERIRCMALRILNFTGNVSAPPEISMDSFSNAIPGAIENLFNMLDQGMDVREAAERQRLAGEPIRDWQSVYSDVQAHLLVGSEQVVDALFQEAPSGTFAFVIEDETLTFADMILFLREADEVRSFHIRASGYGFEKIQESTPSLAYSTWAELKRSLACTTGLRAVNPQAVLVTDLPLKDLDHEWLAHALQVRQLLDEARRSVADPKALPGLEDLAIVDDFFVSALDKQSHVGTSKGSCEGDLAMELVDSYQRFRKAWYQIHATDFLHVPGYMEQKRSIQFLTTQLLTLEASDWLILVSKMLDSWTQASQLASAQWVSPNLLLTGDDIRRWTLALEQGGVEEVLADLEGLKEFADRCVHEIVQKEQAEVKTLSCLSETWPVTRGIIEKQRDVVAAGLDELPYRGFEEVSEEDLARSLEQAIALGAQTRSLQRALVEWEIVVRRRLQLMLLGKGCSQMELALVLDRLREGEALHFEWQKVMGEDFLGFEHGIALLKELDTLRNSIRKLGKELFPRSDSGNPEEWGIIKRLNRRVAQGEGIESLPKDEDDRRIYVAEKVGQWVTLSDLHKSPFKLPAEQGFEALYANGLTPELLQDASVSSRESLELWWNNR